MKNTNEDIIDANDNIIDTNEDMIDTNEDMIVTSEDTIDTNKDKLNKNDMDIVINRKINHHIKKHNLGIYIHIPFCVKKCEYCDFLSFHGNKALQKEYVNALVGEILSYDKLAKDYKVRTIFIGGGTPSIMEGKDIAFILKTVKEVFNKNEDGDSFGSEVTIECNPGTLTKEKLLEYKEAGINRLSIGLQSANNDELKLLGRIHTFEEFEENYNLAREVGFENINIDLMSALPGQTIDGWINTLNKVISLNPEHISAYSLIIEEGTPFFDKYGMKENYKNEIRHDLENESKLPNEDEDRAIYQKTKEILEASGYLRYEISNYGKLGYECIHNSSYWERTPYIGIGLGSSSLINNNRFHNVEDIHEYIKYSYDHEKIKKDNEELTMNQQMEEFMFLGLRMCKGISRHKFAKLFNIDIDQVYGEVISNLMDKKLLIHQEDRIFLSKKGIDVSNYVLAEFLL